MNRKHIVLVHGRATKPRRQEKERLTRSALLHGLERVDQAAAEKVRSGEIRFSLAYYGDLNNEILHRYEPSTRAGMVRYEGQWYEEDGCYDESLAALFARPTERHRRSDYRALLSGVEDSSSVDDLFRILSPVLSLTRIDDLVVRKKLPDLWRYLTSRVDGSRIRQRLQAPLLAALRTGDEVCLIAHSMGSIVAYDVLWKLSRMSEYEDVHGRKVALWLTIGSPLGDAFTRQHLYDAGEPDDGVHPTNVEHWINVAAHDDYVAYDGSVSDDFRAMRERRYCRRIEDARRIHAFWVGSTGASNPHKLYGYLDHPDVGRRIARWIQAGAAAPEEGGRREAHSAGA